MAAPSRFASLADEDIEQLIFDKDAKNTRSLIDKSVKLLNVYCAEKGISDVHDVDSLTDSELDEL